MGWVGYHAREADGVETDTQGAKAVGGGAEDGRGGRDSARLHCRLGGGGSAAPAVAARARASASVLDSH